MATAGERGHRHGVVAGRSLGRLGFDDEGGRGRKRPGGQRPVGGAVGPARVQEQGGVQLLDGGHRHVGPGPHRRRLVHPGAAVPTGKVCGPKSGEVGRSPRRRPAAAGGPRRRAPLRAHCPPAPAACTSARPPADRRRRPPPPTPWPRRRAAPSWRRPRPAPPAAWPTGPVVNGAPAWASRSTARARASSGWRRARPGRWRCRGGVAGAAEHRHDGEGADDHEGVGEEVVERGAHALGGGGLEAEQDEPGVVDRRVGQHPLHVALDHRQAGPDEQGHEGEPVDHRPPVGGARRRRRRRRPARAPAKPPLGHRRHEPGHRRGGALVDVGGPHVERHGGDLEGEPDQQEGRPARSRPSR